MDWLNDSWPFVLLVVAFFALHLFGHGHHGGGHSHSHAGGGCGAHGHAGSNPSTGEATADPTVANR